MSVFPKRLRDGYATFRSGRLAEDRDRYRHLAELGQQPETMIIACCDSRSAPETIFDAAPGELFVHRNVANLIPPFNADGQQHGTSAALEFGVTGLNVRNIVVMGHGRCGGVHAYLSGGAPTGSDFIGPWIGLLLPAAELVADDAMGGKDPQQALEFASIRQSIKHLRSFPWVKSAEADGTLTLHGAWFDISSGELLALDSDTGTFVALT